MRSMVVLAGLALPFILPPGLAAAQGDAYCTIPGTRQIDPRATATFQQLAQGADPQVMGMLAGVWYAELRSPATNQIDYQHNIYQPGGLFQYHSRICGGMTGGCLEYGGSGLYAARWMGDGTFFGMRIVSDRSRDHQCTGLNGRFLNPTTIVAGDGTTWRRVQ